MIPDSSSRRRARLLHAAIAEYAAAVERFISSAQILLAWELREREAARPVSPRGETAPATPRPERRRIARQQPAEPPQRQPSKSVVGKFPTTSSARVLELVRPTA